MPAKSRFSDSVKAEMVRMRVEDGKSNFAIAIHFNAPPQSVGYILAQLAPIKPGTTVGTAKRRSGRRRLPTSPRGCLKCKQTFESEGNHNWICSPCGNQNLHTTDRFELTYGFGTR